jgi:hypothetical protein
VLLKVNPVLEFLLNLIVVDECLIDLYIVTNTVLFLGCGKQKTSLYVKYLKILIFFYLKA